MDLNRRHKLTKEETEHVKKITNSGRLYYDYDPLIESARNFAYETCRRYNRNETDIVLWKCDLSVHSHFQIVTPDPAHIFGYDDAYFALVHKSHHALPIRSLEVRAGVSVIHEILDVPKSLFLCVLD